MASLILNDLAYALMIIECVFLSTLLFLNFLYNSKTFYSLADCLNKI